MVPTNLAKANSDDDLNYCPFNKLIKEKFSIGKFVPPIFDSSRHLFRHLTLRSVIIPDRKLHSIFIQAQAGQGKSTLAAQFLQHMRAEYGWIQIDSKDRDPIVFITAIFTALLQNFKLLKNSNAYHAILNRELDSGDPERIVHMLLKDLVPLIKDNYYLVLDDLHLLQDSKKCIHFLQIFKAQLPQGFHLILLSRTSFAGLAENCVCLGNNDLALHQNEIKDLFSKIYKLSLPADILSQLHFATEGWVMGAVMVKQVLYDHPGYKISTLSQILKDCRPNQFRKYFQNELFSSLSVSQRRILLSLGLLEDIPRDLAASLSVKINLSGFIDNLVESNFFIRNVSDTDCTYYFHHLFKQFLQERAAVELSWRQQRKVLALAGHWFLRRDMIEQALRYYLRAEAFGMAEKILGKAALYLAAANRGGSLADIISAISHKKVFSYPWLSLSIAYIHFRNDPIKGRIYLEQARKMFIKKVDSLGELISTTSLIVFHASIDCRFNKGKALLPRAEELYKKLYNKLSTPARVQAAYAICFGLCHHVGQPHKASSYITSAFSLAQENNLEGATAGVAIAKGIVKMMLGVWSAFRQHIESTTILFFSPRVGRTNRLLLFSQQLTLLGLQGSFTLYTYYRKMMKDLIAQSLLTQTVPGHNLLMADINMALAQGRNDRAVSIIRSGMASENIGQSPHVQSLYLAYLAFTFALTGKKGKREILSLAVKSAHLRQQAGGPYHEMVNQMILGGVYTLLNMTGEAMNLLSRSISLSEKMGEKFICVSAYAHRSLLYLKNNQIEPALNDIRTCLKMMKGYQHVYFYTWYPALMQKVLTTAVINDIEKKYAQMLARKRLSITITPGGDQIPILDITTLGDLELKLNEELKVSYTDFTTSQRELLAMLVSAPDANLPLEIIQVAFWPDSPADKVRSKLDNMIARIRKLLNKHLAPHSANLYISTAKGFLSLTNCRIDVHRFNRNAERGLEHLNRGEYWQAGNAFLKASLLYRGKFMPKVNLQERAAQLREELQRSFLECTRHWVQMLSAVERFPEAIHFCQKALELDSTSNWLVKNLYDLFTQRNESENAAAVIDKYKISLAREGFSEKEIDLIMEDFWG